MSGGVDSSVAAVLLEQQGYSVIGVTMRLWSQDTINAATGHHQGCCSVEDVEDARRVCQILGVPHYFLDFQNEFSTHVMDYFVAEFFEDHNQLNLLKGGIYLADQVNTVSPGYTEELRTQLGSHGLHEIYARKGENFSGILNGCDYDEWNPETDSHLPACFSATDLKGKKQGKKTAGDF